MRTATKSLFKAGAGSAGMEMALVAPLLITLMFGAFELGTYFWSEHKVVKGVRDAARYASRLSFTKFSCSSSDIIVGGGSTSADTTKINEIKNLARTGELSGGTARVYGWVDSDITVSVSCPATPVTGGIYKGMANAPRVTVSATNVPYPSLFGAIGFDSSALTLSASSQSAVMGI